MEETTLRAATLQPRGLVFDDQTQCTEALSRLNTMRIEGHLCDAVLEVGSRHIAIHRAILACTSTYLFERFSMPAASSSSSPGNNSGAEEMLGRDGNKHQHVRLDGLDFDSVEILVNYAYTSRVECDADQVKSVYMSASTLKMHHMTEACSQFLADNLTVQNCLSTRSFAASCCDDELMSRTNCFIQEHVQAIIERSQEFLQIPSIIVDIVGVEPQNLNIDAEQPLCKLVVDWLDTAMQDESVDRLSEDRHILQLTSENSLRDCLEELEDEELNQSNIVRDYKKLGRKKMMAPLKGSREKVNGTRLPCSTSNSSPPNEQSSSTESLTSTGGGETSVVATLMIGVKTFVCIAILHDNPVRISIKFRPQVPNGGHIDWNGSLGSDFQRSAVHEDHCDSDFDVEKRCTLTPLAAMSSARCGLGTAVLNGHLVAVGGYDRGECLNSVESFDLSSNTWFSLKPMLEARGRFTVAEMAGCLYACGGSNGQMDLCSAECYDPDIATWTLLPDMSVQRSCAGIAASGVNLYVIGGWSGCTGLSLCECYNADTKTWRPIAELNIGRSQVAVCALEDGRIVAVGGCDAWNCTNTVEVYSPLEDKWDLLPPLAVARRGAGVTCFNNKLFVVGGSDSQMSLVSVEVFDFMTGSWSFGPNLATPRANMGVAVSHGRLFAVGGFSGKAFLDSMEYLSSDGDQWSAYWPGVNSGDQSNSSSLPDSPDRLDCILQINNDVCSS